MQRSTIIKTAALLGVSVLGSAAAFSASAPTAEQLLPADTFAIINVPDWDKAIAYFDGSPQGRLWADPAMKPFRESFVKRFSEAVLKPLERELGFSFRDCKDIMDGQIAFALTRNGSDGKSQRPMGWILLIDAKNKQDQLQIRLADLKTKWAQGGRMVRAEKIRGAEFVTLIGDQNGLNRALEKAFPKSPEAEENRAETKATNKDSGQYEIRFGKLDSFLIVGNTMRGVETVVARLRGAAFPVLAEQAVFEKARGPVRGGLVTAWLDFESVYEIFSQQFDSSANSNRVASPTGPPWDKVLAATGLSSLKTAAVKIGGSKEGSSVEAFLFAPEASRRGILRAVTSENKESSPPPSVPADAIKFGRWRIDGQKLWDAFEELLTSVSPEMAGLLQLGFETVGKDKDPNFDLKKALIGNLGDDFICFQRKSRTTSPTDTNSWSWLLLVASPNPDQFVQALQASTSLLPLAATEVTVRVSEFLGRRIYSVPWRETSNHNSSQRGQRTFNFVAGTKYVCLSTDVSLIEDYLRTRPSQDKSLRATAGLTEAAQKVGGMKTGYFGFQNQAESMRRTFENLKRDSTAFDKLVATSRLKGQLDAETAQQFKGWFDFSLLPEFDRVAPYFHFVVYSLDSTREGLTWKLFAPTPPGLAGP